MDGLGECACFGTPHACKAFASKPFSGWPPLNTLGLNGDWTLTTHYLTYTCTITQTWDVQWLAADGVTVLNSYTRTKTRTLTVRRNRYTNDQTVESSYSGDETGIFWGALNFVSESGDFYGYVWAFNTDNFANPDGNDFVGNEGGEYFNVIEPYLATYNGFMCVKAEYFTPGEPFVFPSGVRAWNSEVTFWEGGNPLDANGFTVNHVTIGISEQQTSLYTLADCEADQALLIAANTIERLRTKSNQNKIETYVGYNDAMTIVYADLGDSGEFYPYAMLGDPRTPWADSTTRNFVPWNYKLEDYTLNVTTPIVPAYGGNPLQVCIESKSVFIETGGIGYLLTVNNWPDNSAIGSQTGSIEWVGDDGREVELTCDHNESKLISEI